MEVFDTFISTVLGKETAKKEQEEEKPVEEKVREIRQVLLLGL